MPPRNELPEGTDKIINGAAETGGGGSNGGGAARGGRGAGSTGGTGSGGGFVAKGSGNDTGAAAGSGATDRIVSQVREQVTSLRDQASDKARQLAEGGKDKTTELLDDVAEIIHDAARSIDDRLGDQYGEYAHKAGDAVASIAGNLRQSSLEDLLKGTRTVVRKSPAVTVGTAALLGFILVRLVKSGLEDVGGGGRRSGGRSGGGSGGSGAGA